MAFVPVNGDSMMPGMQSDLMPDTQSDMMPETQSDLMPDTQSDMMPDTQCDDAASLTSLQKEQGQPVVQQTTTNVTYAGMLKRVACELVEVAMKQSNEAKRVVICGMMLRLTNLLKGNELLTVCKTPSLIGEKVVATSASCRGERI